MNSSMKRAMLLSSLLVLALVFGACVNEPEGTVVEEPMAAAVIEEDIVSEEVIDDEWPDPIDVAWDTELVAIWNDVGLDPFWNREVEMALTWATTLIGYGEHYGASTDLDHFGSSCYQLP